MAGLSRYNEDDIVVDTQRLTTSTWSNNTNNLKTTHTSSIQANFNSPSSSGQFYLNVFNFPTSSDSASVQ